MRKDDCVFLFEPRGNLFEIIEKLSTKFSGEETLFVVDDMIADETLDKRRNPLLELAISGRHRQHSLWLFTQSYTAIPKNLRRQKKQFFLWYPSEKSDLRTADEETNLMTSDDLVKIKEQLKSEKHACLYVRLEHPRGFQDLKINMEEVTKPKNPGRVAAGKRTAALNRKRKEDLLRNQKTVP